MRRILLSTATILASVTPALAQTAAPTPIVLPDTIVTATGVPTPLARVPASITVIDRRAIEESGFANLAEALAPYGVEPDAIPTAFNCFMNVPIDGSTGAFTVEPPLSRAGDTITFRAEMDLIIGLTACSALQSNGGSFKPIQYSIS
jgi:hypothetical protein